MDKETDELKYWLCIGRNPKIGAATFSEILSKNLPMKDIYFADEKKLISLGLSKRTIAEILVSQRYDPDNITEELRKREINAITILGEEYPALLKEIYDPPAILYYKGQPINSDEFMIAVVGSRKYTDYGARATTEIAQGLAKKGVVIVSGMARGIDTLAHQAALDVGGKTIAVLGCGLDQIYPSSNVQLAKEIIKNGTIISEFPIGVKPMKFNFPLRNRIISGLSNGLVVTEAAESSGSLITANSALEQNKDIFAVPGSIYHTNCQGPHNLIKMGARLITSANDVLDELGVETEKTLNTLPKGENHIEDAIIKILAEEPKQIDAIIKESKLDHQKISSSLTMMEISGKISHIGGLVYKIKYQ